MINSKHLDLSNPLPQPNLVLLRQHRVEVIAAADGVIEESEKDFMVRVEDRSADSTAERHVSLGEVPCASARRIWNAEPRRRGEHTNERHQRDSASADQRDDSE